MDANIKEQEIVLECKSYECESTNYAVNDDGCLSNESDEESEECDDCDEAPCKEAEDVPECTTEAVSTQPEPAPQPLVAEPFAGTRL